MNSGRVLPQLTQLSTSTPWPCAFSASAKYFKASVGVPKNTSRPPLSNRMTLLNIWKIFELG